MPSTQPQNHEKAGLVAVARVFLTASILALAPWPAGAQDKSVTIEAPWIRLIIPSRPAAGYLTLRNDTDSDTAITAASSPACGDLSLHESVTKDGAATMVPVDKVDATAGGAATFAPGGYHLMCMKPQPELEVGASVPVTLTLSGGQEITQDFPVYGAGGKPESK